MTPRSGTAGDDTNESEKETEAVPVDTESGQDAAALAVEAPDTAEKDAATSEHVEGTDDADESEDDAEGKDDSPAQTKPRTSLSRLAAFGLLPCLMLLLAAAGGYLKWQSSSIRASQTSSVESVAVAKDGTVAMLSYQPDTVEKDLGGARDLLTGTFKESYTQLTHDVVIPGAKQRHISAVATVPAAASVSATAGHAVALVFVNQTVVVGTDAPSATASSVRVTMDKVGDRWLISGFDPV